MAGEQESNLGEAFRRVDECASTKLSDLVKAAGLDPATGLREMELTDEDLSFDALTGFDFTGADLRGVNFEGADLSNANLSKAVLTGSNLEKAKSLSGCKYDGGTIFPEGFTPHGKGMIKVSK